MPGQLITIIITTVIGGMFEVIEGQTLQITCSSHSVTNLHLYENGLALPILPIINDLQAHFLLSVTRSDNERRLRCGDSRVLSPEQEITVYCKCKDMVLC